MGQELMCNAQFDGKASHGKAMLETDYALFRGEFRIKIAFASMRSVKAQGDWLAIDSPEAMNMSQKGVNKCSLFLERRSE